MENYTSTQPENEGSLAGLLTTFLNKIKQQMENRLPCVVTKVDRDSNRVNVMPLMDVILANGGTQQRAIVSDVMIKNLSAGNFIINFPIQVGDFGWLEANDRDITLFKQSYKQTKPNTTRKHSFEDAIFHPDTINPSNFSIAGEDASALVIQSYDNSTKISMGAGKIIIQADEIEQRATTHKFVDGRITHDDVYIDKGHGHPQGNDSDGDAEQDTDTPINVI